MTGTRQSLQYLQDALARRGGALELPVLEAMPHLVTIEGDGVLLRSPEWPAALAEFCSSGRLTARLSGAVSHWLPQIADDASRTYSGPWIAARYLEKKIERTPSDVIRALESVTPEESAASRQRMLAPAPLPFQRFHDDEHAGIVALWREIIAASNNPGRYRQALIDGYNGGALDPAYIAVWADLPELGPMPDGPNPYVVAAENEAARINADTDALARLLEQCDQRPGSGAARALKRPRAAPKKRSDRIAARFAARTLPLFFGNQIPGERSKYVQRIAEWFLATAEPERFDVASRHYRKPPSEKLYRGN